MTTLQWSDFLFGVARIRPPLSGRSLPARCSGLTVRLVLREGARNDGLVWCCDECREAALRLCWRVGILGTMPRSPANTASRLFAKLWRKESDRFAKALMPVLRRQHKRALAAFQSIENVEKRIIRKQLGPADASLIYPSGQNENQIRDAARPELERIAAVGARRLTRILTKRFNTLPFEMQVAISDMLDEQFSSDFWVQNFGEATRRRIANLLFRSIQEGMTPAETFELLRQDRLGIFSMTRAERIARTEVTAMLNGGAYLARRQGWADGLVIGEQWSAILDRVTRNSHRAAHGQTVSQGADGRMVVRDINNQEIAEGRLFVIGSERARFPGDPNLSAANRVHCFLPSTRIQGNVSAVVRSRYCGQAVEVLTNGGRRLCATPNHPIATPDGMVAAGEIDAGCEVLIDRSNILDPLFLSQHDIDDEPPRIDQIFNAFSQGCRSIGDRSLHEVVHGEMVDFEGDEAFCVGDVDVVWADRELLIHLIAGSEQHGCNSVLVGESLELASVGRLRPLDSFGDAVLSSPARFVGGGNLMGPLAGCHLGPLESLGIGLIARIHAAVLQDRSDDPPAGMEFLRQLVHRDAVVEQVNYFGAVEFRRASGSPMATLVSHGFASAHKPGLDRVPADPKPLANGFGRLASPVAFDDVVEVKRFHYDGFVYCVESPHGVIVADGIYAHNCRCTTFEILSP